MTKAEIGEPKLVMTIKRICLQMDLNGLDFGQKRKDQDPPTEGLVHFEYDTFISLRKAAGIKKWINDGLLHTAASMFHQNLAFKSTTSYWLDSFGHDRAVYKRNYADVKNPNEVKDYFNILPPETK